MKYLIVKPCNSSSSSSSLQLLELIKQCKSLETLKQIHSYMLTNSIHKPTHLLSKLVQLKELRYSTLLFSTIPRPTAFSFNLMIRGLATIWRNYPDAISYYLRMIRCGEKPNNFTLPFVLISTSKIQSLFHGRAIHCSAVKLGLVMELNTQNSLITMYAMCNELLCARMVFDEMHDKDLVSWNSMISGYSKMGFSAEAVDVFHKMRKMGLRPDEMTVVSVLTACRDLGDSSSGGFLEQLVEKDGLEMNSFVGSALIDMYAKCGDLASARRVFDGMLEKDLVVWNSMITGYAQNGSSNEAIALYHSMKEARIELDKITIVGVLSACSEIGALDLGIEMHAEASTLGLHQNVYVGTALVDMYAKCGNVDRALEIFNNMVQKNVAAWNAMISALAFHGRGKEAISLFSCMVREEEEGSEVCPNEITFVGVLSACVHSGMVNEGRYWFTQMKFKYGISPKMQHFSCMVDLLARSGRLEDALEFVLKMPEKPDAVVLGALLCACRNNSTKNIEVAEKIIERILDLEPLNSGSYVISSNVYAGSGKWEDYARMIGLMRQRGVIKSPGCSWIEIDNKVQKFKAGDGLHQNSVEIHQLISLLSEDMSMKVGEIWNNSEEIS